MWFRKAAPLSDEIRQWVDDILQELAALLGRERMLQTRVLLPAVEDFPDTYDASEDAVLTLLARVAAHMQVNPALIDLEFFLDAGKITGSLVPFGERSHEGAAGLYAHDDAARSRIAISLDLAKDPAKLVATLAHELGHVLLLKSGLVQIDRQDMEPMNDLLMVFLGLGVFSANTAIQFRQYTNNDSQGWSISRSGYLPESVWGYALARFAHARGEKDPAWARHLAGNIKPYFKQSARWLATQPRT